MTTDTATLVDVTMPKLSDSMEDASILQWLKHEGDTVAKGDALVEVETDKATIVYEAELAGVLAEIVVAEGGTAPLGGVIARVAVEGVAPAAKASPPEAKPAVTEPAPAVTAHAPVPPRSAGRARATPVARRLASELGVSLGEVTGTGPGGRIVRADVRAAAGDGRSSTGASPAPAEAAGRGAVAEMKLSATQRTIAARMSESRSEIPDFTVEADVLMDAAHELRAEIKAAGRRPVPSFNDLLVKAVALALRDFPGLNAAWEDGRVLRFGRVNIGVAVATEDALLVPTIVDADAKSVFEIAEASRRLSARVRDRSIQLSELADGTFTISNLGMFGVRRFNAVINRPQVAILAAGELALRPWVDERGELVARRTMAVSLSCDHRVVYGADAARFLQRLRHLLEHPVQLIVSP